MYISDENKAKTRPKCWFWLADSVERWGHITCHILDPAVFITGSLYITCYDVVICDSWLTATWTVPTIRQSVMLDTPAPEATAQKCYICPVRWALFWLKLPVHWGIHTLFNYTLTHLSLCMCVWWKVTNN